MQLSFFQKKLRSFIKRALPSFVNQSDTYILQHLPESVKSIARYRNIWTAGNKKNNDVDLIRLLFLSCMVEELENIPGAFAELGVYKGNSAKLLHTLAPERELYLFDTFAGFDTGDVHTDPKLKIHKNHFLDTSLEAVKQFIQGSEKVHFCSGHFPATAKQVPEKETFALVHLDADLYAPTLAGLQFFYPRLFHGGAMIIHDYFSGAWPGVKQAVDEFLKDKPEKIIRIPDKSGTGVFRTYMHP